MWFEVMHTVDIRLAGTKQEKKFQTKHQETTQP